MTDEQIIQALELCFTSDFEDCEECPLKDKQDAIFSCMRIKQEIILDLINRQKAEIERLRTMNSELNIGIKKLKEFAIKEFAEKVKQEINFPLAVWRVFDNIVKEMTEPVKLEHNSLCETETYVGE